MFQRYAIYFVPDAHWGDFGASWLGWDNRRAVDVRSIAPEDLTRRPQKYGFHATIKAPFRLADGVQQADLEAAAHRLCSGLNAVDLPSLHLSQIGRFFALTAPDEAVQLKSLAADVVRGLDQFRAPLSEEELARRRQSRLSPAQDAYLCKWGYPYVMDEITAFT